MKRFACGDVVPGCEATWVCTAEDDILSDVAVHNSADHGLIEVSPALVAAVRANIAPVT